MPLKVVYNQARKQHWPVNDALKIQKTFHKSHDIINKLLVIIRVDNMSAKKEINFSQTKP